jgi:NAD(P)H-hydrate epimerase
MPVYLKNNPDLNLNLVEYSDLSFPKIAENDHKYSAGKLFILAGSTGMTGAASLSANAALRTGIGLVTIGIPKSLNPIIEVKVTEGLTLPLPETEQGMISESALTQIEEKIHWADAVVIGPGCGRERETQDVLNQSIALCLNYHKPLLIDADALFALSGDISLLKKLTGKVLLTPHHGEFLRFTSFEKTDLINQPWHFLKEFVSDKNFSVNLKGAPSMVATPNGDIFINPTGNPGLAKGGSGDVLSGLIGTLMAKGIEASSAAITGNYIHGEAADILVDIYGVTSLLPSDLIDVLPELLDQS